MKTMPKIVAAGRGRTMSSPVIVQTVLDLIKPQDQFRMVYLGTASYDKKSSFEAQTAPYRALPHCEVVPLTVSEAAKEIPSQEEIKSTLMSADAILVSGGNTLYALNRWKALGIDEIIQQALENDTVLCGGSAGAVCWFDSGHSDSMNPASWLHVDPRTLTEEEKNDWDYIK